MFLRHFLLLTVNHDGIHFTSESLSNDIVLNPTGANFMLMLTSCLMFVRKLTRRRMTTPPVDPLDLFACC
jgi:hypothetical protein